MRRRFALIAVVVALFAFIATAISAVYPGGVDPIKVEQNWRQIDEQVWRAGVPGGHVHEYYYLNPDLTADVLITCIVKLCPKFGGNYIGVVYRDKAGKVHVIKFNTTQQMFEYMPNPDWNPEMLKGWHKTFNKLLSDQGIGEAS